MTRKIMFVLILLFSSSAFALPDTPVLPKVATYSELVQAIREARAASQARLDRAVDREKVREAWEIGKLIDQHVLQHKERADYGKKVIIRLANDLATSETELKYMLQFARTYPIRPPADELSWAHYREILSINEDEKRREVTAQAVRENWSRDQVRAEVSRRKISKNRLGQKPEKLTAEPGKIETYRIVRAQAGPDKGELVIDLGFSNYFRFGDMSKFKEGDVVQATPLKTSKPGMVSYQFTKIPASRTQTTGDEYLFTYKAYVTQVIDGDTFDAVIDLGFKFTTFQKLRLRGLDASEIISAEGREAKAFLEKRFAASGNAVLIKTEKSDKYDRYLADVWGAPIRDKEASYTYINQELLEEGLAVRTVD